MIYVIIITVWLFILDPVISLGYLIHAILFHRARYCCMVRPWHLHLVGDLPYDTDGYALFGFSVTDRGVYEEDLGELLAHENRHIIHSYIGGILYSILYSISNRFREWAECNCDKAALNPLRHYRTDKC